MRIVNLVENTVGKSECGAEHGLSFYIETKRHRILMDTGPSDLLLGNAERLGIDLSLVDTVILSHGHFDHGGGILPFAGVNSGAKIYMRREALGSFYSDHGEPELRYIGLDPAVAGMDRLVLIDEDVYRIDDELFLFSGITGRKALPLTNKNLKRKAGDEVLEDDFVHEQCLVITEGARKILLSGCAHHGILNVLDRYREVVGGEPYAVISGFHMLRKKDDYTGEDIRIILDTARELKKYRTVFYTCHCTGIKPYKAMHRIMGNQIRYVHSGDTVNISTEKKRRGGMKLHRAFAWATVACFLATMVTGYLKK